MTGTLTWPDAALLPQVYAIRTPKRDLPYLAPPQSQPFSRQDVTRATTEQSS